MMTDPTPLRASREASASLRRALEHSAATPPIAFDVDAGLDAFLRATNTALPSASAAGIGAHAARGAASFRHPTWWGLAAVGVASALLASRAIRLPASADAASVRTIVPASERVPARESAARGVSMPVPNAPVAMSYPTMARRAPIRRAVRAARVESARRVTMRQPIEALTVRADAARRTSDDQPFADRLDRERARLEYAFGEIARNPTHALAVANGRPGEFPDSIHVDEWESLAIRALMQLGRRNEARARARQYLTHLWRGPGAEYVRGLVGVPAPIP